MGRVFLAVLCCAALAACGVASGPPSGPNAHGDDVGTARDGPGQERGAAAGKASATDRAAGAGGSGLDGTITVLAAASLTESFDRIADGFERRHPGVTVRTSFAASSTLARQVESGAPADVFASADPDQFEDLATADRPRVIARNRLRLAVPTGNPGDVRSLADLTDESLRVAICAAEVPCGQAARHALRVTDLDLEPDTLGNDVKKVLTLVRLGEVDAGLVYATDVVAARDQVRGIDLPADAAPARDYPAATLPDAPNPPGARAFLRYLGSDEARQVLRDAGFEPA